MAYPPTVNGNWYTALQLWDGAATYRFSYSGTQFKSLTEVYAHQPGAIRVFDVSGNGVSTLITPLDDLCTTTVTGASIAIFKNQLYIAIKCPGDPLGDIQIHRWNGGSSFTLVYSVEDANILNVHLWADNTYLYINWNITTFRTSTPDGAWSQVLSMDDYACGKIEGSPFRPGTAMFVGGVLTDGDEESPAPAGNYILWKFENGTITTVSNSASTGSYVDIYKHVHDNNMWMKIGGVWGPTSDYETHIVVPSEGSIEPLVMPTYSQVAGVNNSNDTIRYFDVDAGEWDIVVDDIDDIDYYDADGYHMFVRSDGSTFYSAYGSSGFGAYLTRNDNLDPAYFVDDEEEPVSDPASTHAILYWQNTGSSQNMNTVTIDE